MASSAGAGAGEKGAKNECTEAVLGEASRVSTHIHAQRTTELHSCCIGIMGLRVFSSAELRACPRRKQAKRLWTSELAGKLQRSYETRLESINRLFSTRDGESLHLQAARRSQRDVDRAEAREAESGKRQGGHHIQSEHPLFSSVPSSSLPNGQQTTRSRGLRDFSRGNSSLALSSPCSLFSSLVVDLFQGSSLPVPTSSSLEAAQHSVSSRRSASHRAFASSLTGFLGNSKQPVHNGRVTSEQVR
jgi:hypothetical protein